MAEREPNDPEDKDMALPRRELQREISEAMRIFKPNQQLEDIRSGVRTLEVKVAYPVFSIINPRQVIVFFSRSGVEVPVRVKNVKLHATLYDFMRRRDLNKLAPGKRSDEIAKEAKAFFNEEDIRRHGLIAFEFEVLKM